jgi:hypothetical protein
MRKPFLLCCTLLIAAAGWQAAPATAQMNPEEGAVRTVMEAYFSGLKNRDIPALQKVIQAEARFISVNREGKFDELTQEKWHALIHPSEQSPGPYDMSGAILSVDITGNTAAVKSTVDMPRVIFQEYVGLLKIDGRWKIVSKVYALKGKPRT